MTPWTHSHREFGQPRAVESTGNNAFHRRSDAGSGEADLLFSAITQERKLNLSRLNPIDYIAFLWWILSGSRKTTNVEQKSRIRLS